MQLQRVVTTGIENVPVLLDILRARAYARGGFGVKTTLELDILRKLYACAKEINCFRIPFAC